MKYIKKVAICYYDKENNKSELFLLEGKDVRPKFKPLFKE